MKKYFTCIRWRTSQASALGGENSYEFNYIISVDLRDATRSDVVEAILRQTNIGGFRGLVESSIVVSMMVEVG